LSPNYVTPELVLKNPKELMLSRLEMLKNIWSLPKGAMGSTHIKIKTLQICSKRHGQQESL